MHIRAINSWIRAPLLLMGGIELAILFSSLYVSTVVQYPSIDAGISVIGPILPKACLIAAFGLICLIAMGLYQFNQRLYFREAAVRVIVGLAVAYLAVGVLAYLFEGVVLERQHAAIAFAYSLTGVLAMRFLFARTLDENVFRRRTLVLGAGERATALLDFRRSSDRRGFKIIGRVAAPGDKVVGDRSDILELGDRSIADIARERNAHEIVVAMDDRRGNLPVRDLLDARLKGIDVVDFLEFLEREGGKIRVDLINPGWLIFSHGFRISKLRRFSERVVSLLASAGLVLVSWPLMLLVAIAIKIEDGLSAPVFYRQTRVGQGGETFDVLKFRSMAIDAEGDGKARWATKDDSRITRVGRVLRKSRIDELPQVFNVLKGEMSLVGPRPERPEFVEELQKKIPYYAERHAVKPGVTGWAQLRYSYGASEEDALEKLQYDLYYIKNQSLMLDIMIILQTVEVVLWGKGAR
jgi:sugar transferase (PEP-CTERM system associated)